MEFSAFPVLLLIGCAILAGSVGGRIFQRLHIPQVVGYIVIGVVVGQSGLRLNRISQEVWRRRRLADGGGQEAAT